MFGLISGDVTKRDVQEKASAVAGGRADLEAIVGIEGAVVIDACDQIDLGTGLAAGSGEIELGGLTIQLGGAEVRAIAKGEVDRIVEADGNVGWHGRILRDQGSAAVDVQEVQQLTPRILQIQPGGGEIDFAAGDVGIALHRPEARDPAGLEKLLVDPFLLDRPHQ